MNKILEIYKESNLIIQSFVLKEIIHKNGEYKKEASKLPMDWQNATSTNIKSKHNGFLLVTGTKINNKYIIAIDIDNKEDTEEYFNGLKFWNELIKKNNYTVTSPTQLTGNNGFHILFFLSQKQYNNISKNITSLEIKEKAYSIDIKCKKGCIYCEPTQYESLTGGTKYYKWIIEPKIEYIQDIPDFLYNIIYDYHYNRNKTTITRIKKIKETKEIKERKERSIIQEINIENIDITKEHLELINMFDKKRFINTELWFNIGIVFKSVNIPYSLYSELSKQNYALYCEEDCLKYWNGYKKKNYNINVLHKIAKNDSPEEYKKLKKKEIEYQKDCYTNEKNQILITNNYFDFEFNKLKIYDDIIIKSNPGTGKTFYISLFLKQLKQEDSKIKIMSIIPQTCLISQHLKAFKANEINLLNYQETNNLINNDFIICINSLCKIINISDEDLQNYVIFIDEIDSFISNLTDNQTLNMDLKLIMILLYRILNKCKKCIYASAHVKENLKYILNDNKNSVFIVNDYIKQKGTKAYEVNNLDFMILKMKENIKNNEYFLSAFDSIKLATKFYNIVYELIEDKSKIILITSETNVKIIDASEEFKDKYVFYSPSITYGVDVSFTNFQDVFVFSRSLSISPYLLYQQSTRCRLIRNVYYYIEKVNKQLKYKSLEDAKEKIKEQIKINSLLTNLFCNVNENYEPVISCNKFFDLYCWEKYHNDLYMYDMKKTYEDILTEHGFEIIKDTSEEKKLNQELDKKLKKEIDDDIEIIINEYIKGDEKEREKDKYKNIHNRAKVLKIEKIKEIEKYKEIIKTDKGMKNHTNLIRLLKNDEYIKLKISKFKETSMEVKLMNEVHNKIALIRKIEKDNNIKNLDLDFEENDEVVMTNETFKLLKILFSTVKKKPTNRHELKIFYVSMIRHLTPDIIKRTMFDKVINKQRKIITKYTLNKENIILSLELDKYSNHDRKNFNDIIKNFENNQDDFIPK